MTPLKIAPCGGFNCLLTGSPIPRADGSVWCCRLPAHLADAGARLWSRRIAALSLGHGIAMKLQPPQPGGATRLTTVLLQNLLVLAVGARRTSLNTGRGDGDTQQSGRNNRFVTLAVNLQEATALYHALSFAERLHLVRGVREVPQGRPCRGPAALGVVLAVAAAAPPPCP